VPPVASTRVAMTPTTFHTAVLQQQISGIIHAAALVRLTVPALAAPISGRIFAWAATCPTSSTACGNR
jgi:hypothetical protein